MTHQVELSIQRQPDDTTCGPTCLHAVYGFFGDDISLREVIAETRELRDGGTLAVCLASHALRRGYRARIYTYNVLVFDPSWFAADVDLGEKLTQQYLAKGGTRLRQATSAYLEFLDRGGEVHFVDLTTELLTRYLGANVPLLAGLSATYLYQTAREVAPDGGGDGMTSIDDVAGKPVGHFVVLCGWNPTSQQVRIADPFRPNPLAQEAHYWVDVGRLKSSILLGVVTYDAAIVVIEPGGG
jgi:hypothetical protein